METKLATKSLLSTERNIVPILGIKVSSTKLAEVLNQVQTWIEEEKFDLRPRLIVTPNPEIINKASVDPELASIINKSDLSIPDGVGTIAAMRFLHLQTPKHSFYKIPYLIIGGIGVGLSIVKNRPTISGEVVPGRVVFDKLMEISANRGYRVFLVGGGKAVAAIAAKNLNSRYPTLKIQFDEGPWLGEDGKPQKDMDKGKDKETIEKINKFKPDLLFVGFGAPKQEKWLARNLPNLKVKVALTVGGALDYTAGIFPGPPGAFERFGAEWLWRLISQPWRAGRIFTAVVVFPSKVFLYKLRENG